MRKIRLCLAGGAVLLLAAWLAFAQAQRKGVPPSAGRPHMARSIQKAKNPAQLTLLVDAGKVLGWLSGPAKPGASVQVHAGTESASVELDEHNAFTWPYKVSKATRVEFALGESKAAVIVQPRQVQQPCVFFVADRSVYRPEQVLHFAGYLRRLDDRDEFVPLPGETVEVRVTSDRTNSVAARLKTTADDHGRIAGEYAFSAGDTLGTYRLSIPGYLGLARLELAEYRKTEVYLRVSGKRAGNKLRLRFQALDALGRPAPAKRVRYTAGLIRNPVMPSSDVLRGDDFAYAATVPAPLLRVEELDGDSRLLARFDPGYLPDIPGPSEVTGYLTSTVEFRGKSESEDVIDLPQDWQKTTQALVVDATLLDANGREGHAANTIYLSPVADDLRLTLDKKAYMVDEPITATLAGSSARPRKGRAALVAMLISPGPVANLRPGRIDDQTDLLQAFDTQQRGGPPAWHLMPVLSPVRRTLAAATTFAGASATLRLDEPGAYKLIALIDQPGGTKRRQEVGCVVQSAAQVPALSLELDRSGWKTGQTLTGSIRSRFADARVLLTLRDSLGYRAWQTHQLKNGFAAVHLSLPRDLRFGCVVDVQYLDKTDRSPYLSSRFIRVQPIDRFLKVESKITPAVAPGEMVDLDVQVDRKEPVDLVVSVYDKALHHIRPESSVDPRAFFLADDRGQRNHARDLLRRRLGGLTVAELLRRAEPALARCGIRKNDKDALQLNEMSLLLDAAGIKSRVCTDQGWQSVPCGEAREPGLTLADVLEIPYQGRHVYVCKLNQTFFLLDGTADGPNWSIIADFLRECSGADILFPYIGPGNFGGAGVIGALGGNILGAPPGAGLVGGPGTFSGGFGGGFSGGVGGFVGGLVGGTNLGVGGGAAGVNAPGTMPEPPRLPFDALGGEAPNLELRRDFSDSAYWNACLRTDAQGKAHVRFKALDSLTTWHVVVTALSGNHHVRRHTTSFKTERPIMIVPIVPRVLTEGDTVRIGATVVNRSARRQTMRARLKVDNGAVVATSQAVIKLDAGQSGPVTWIVKAGKRGFTELALGADCTAGADAALKKLPVRSGRVERVESRSGFCRGKVEFTLPANVDPGQATLEMCFAPTLAADLVDSLDYLIEYPYGCVEQTISRFLPAILVSRTLKKLGVHHPGLEKKLPGCVDAGVKRLLELQQPDGGWGWNGTSQTHEMMTPYALYGLLAAEKEGYPPGNEPAIKRGLERLRQYLLRLPAEADFVYCLYVYGQRERIEDSWWASIDAALANRRLSDYALALALELSVQKKEPERAARLAAALRKRARTETGQAHWQTGGFSRWADDPLEITASALKALVAFDPGDPLIPGVLNYFAIHKNGNRWNSTKDTAMIVAALCDYLSSQKDDARARARLAYQVNGGDVQSLSFEQLADVQRVFTPGAQLRRGVNTVVFNDAAPGILYRLTLRYPDPRPAGKPLNEGIKVSRGFSLLDDRGKIVRELGSGDEVPVGSFIESWVMPSVDPGERYLLVESPVPAGCEVLPLNDTRFDQATDCVLREDRDTLVAYHYEETTHHLHARCVLHAETTGTFMVPPARAELMYRPQVRGQSRPFTLRVVEVASGKSGDLSSRSRHDAPSSIPNR